jgi:two-component system, response regulator
LDKGATFWFTLGPRNEHTAAALAKGGIMIKDQIDILLVEDDSEDLELTLRILNDEHICNRIQVARDGEEALDILFCHGEHAGRRLASRPRLILLDLKLPKVDGLEVLRRLREDPVMSGTPVVILTSSKLDRDMIQSYNLGANSYIQKPVSFDEFRSTIKELGYYWLLVNQVPPRGAFETNLHDAPVARI